MNTTTEAKIADHFATLVRGGAPIPAAILATADHFHEQGAALGWDADTVAAIRPAVLALLWACVRRTAESF
jgi:hypothetical protein